MMLTRGVLLLLSALAFTGSVWAGEGFAVVELFTSEGCSSCPPADRVLSELVANADTTGRPIYCLAFHVDSWDRLGWADRFASPEYSERQRRYASALGESRVYTPQAIINGSVDVVGSNRRRLVDAIDDALDEDPEADLELTVAVGSDERSLEVEVTVEGVPPGTVLNLAVVERALATDVGRGENAGRTLRHDNVVRAFESHTVAGDAVAVTVNLARQIDRRNASLIAYLQDLQTMRVLAATTAPLSEWGTAAGGQEAAGS